MTKNNDKLIGIALKVPICFVVTLIISKFLVYRSTKSLAIFSSFTDSSLDFASSLISFIALKYSLKKESKNYQYGYHGIIDIATAIVAIFIIITSLTIYYKSIVSIINKSIIEYSSASTFAMIFSSIISVFITTYLTIMYKKTKSILIQSEIAHYGSDIITNIGILTSLIISKFYNHYLIDPLIAIIMAIISLKPAFSILSNSISHIMAKEVDEETRKKIIEIATRNKEVMGYNKLKTRMSGDKIFIQIYIELSSGLPFKAVHDIIDKIQKDVENEIGNSEIMLHADPM